MILKINESGLTTSYEEVGEAIPIDSNKIMDFMDPYFHFNYAGYRIPKEHLTEKALKFHKAMVLNTYFNRAEIKFKLEKYNSSLTLEFSGMKVKIKTTESSGITADRLFFMLYGFYEFKYLVLELNKLQQRNMISIELDE